MYTLLAQIHVQHYYPLEGGGGGDEAGGQAHILQYSCTMYIVVSGNSLFANLISYLQVKVCST